MTPPKLIHTYLIDVQQIPTFSSTYRSSLMQRYGDEAAALCDTLDTALARMQTNQAFIVEWAMPNRVTLSVNQSDYITECVRINASVNKEIPHNVELHIDLYLS